MKKYLLIILLMVVSNAIQSQEKVNLALDANLVSAYIWRGLELAKISVQPSITLSYQGFKLKGWGSIGTQKSDIQEFDLGLTYHTNKFRAGITDYYTKGKFGCFHFSSDRTNHVLGAELAYDFGVLSIDWFTNIAGNDGKNKSGNRAYSSYISATVPFSISGLKCETSIGATPWATTYYNDGANGFEVTDITLKVQKEVRITDVYSIPMYGKIMVNPAVEDTFFAFGIVI
jgi:hypothetical protein